MQNLSGILLVLFSSTCFGVMPLFAHVAYQSGCDPISILWIRFNLAAIVLWLVLPIQNIPPPKFRHCLILLGIGSIYVAQSLCYFTALTLIPASLVALLLYIYPAIVTGLAISLLGEPVKRYKLVALGFSLLGVILTIGVDRGESSWGLILGVLMAWLYAIYVLLVSRVLSHERSALACLTWVMTSAALLYSGMVGLRGWSLPQSSQGWLALVGIALISTALAVVTLFAGVKRIGATSAATLSTWEPVVTVVTASLFLGDRLPPLSLVGGGFILVAVLLIGRPSS
ncbi:MAG: DMT family transporter [Prochlorotrichaceae cyanobacterium]